MRSPALAVALLLIPLPALAQGHGLADVQQFKGTFDATSHDEEPRAGETDDRSLSDGTITLQRVGPGRWEGTVQARLVVKLTVDTQGVASTTYGDGVETGTVVLTLDADGSGYHMTWKLDWVRGTTRVAVAGIQQTAATNVAFAGTGLFDTNGEVPASGLDLVAVDDSHHDPHHVRHVHWELRAQTDLVAVPRVAAVERGQKSHLDGSASTPPGQITGWSWHLAPGGDCPPGAPSGDLRGEQVDVILLCSMKATLVVSAGEERSQPATVSAEVRARKWKTTPDPIQGPDEIPGMGLASNHMQLGQQMCAIEPKDSDPPGHVIHREEKGAGATWEDEAYVIEPVEDPLGPFDGWFWVTEYKGRYQRRMRINRELYPKSATGDANNDTPAHRNGLALVLECAIKHETEHDTQMRKALAQGWDPAPKIEKLFAHQKGDLHDAADQEFLKMQTYFVAQNFFESKVHTALAGQGCAKSVTIMVEGSDGIYHPFTIAKVSDLGDSMVVP